MKPETKNTAMGVISIVLTIIFGLLSIFGVTVAPSIVNFGDPLVAGVGMFLMVLFGGCLGWITRNWRAKKLLGMSVEDTAEVLREYRGLQEKHPEDPIGSLIKENKRLVRKIGRLKAKIKGLEKEGFVSGREIERRSEEHTEEAFKEILEGKY